MSEHSQQRRAAARFDPSGPHEVRFADVEYARPGGEPLLARVYRPVEPGPWPALVDVHGGAWSYLDRNADVYFDRALAACGMVVVALDFRQGAQRFPASIRDVLSGVRFVRHHAAELDAAPEPIGLIGGSSGGHLCLLAAICPAAPEFQEGASQDLGDASVAYALALWPIADPLARYRYLEPLLAGHAPSPHDPFFDPARLRGGQEAHFGDEATMARASIPRILRAREFERLPPIWVAHPEHDRNVTLAMTEDLVAAYRAAGGQATLEVFAGVGHAFANFPGPAADRCIERMRRFCAELLESTRRAEVGK
jgi:acetyl esterase/lipase